MTRLVPMGYAPASTPRRRVPTLGGWKPHGVCLLHPIRTVRAASSATSFASLGKLLSSHRAIIRVSLAALSFTVIAAFSQQPAAQAGPQATPVTPESLLPDSVGIGVDTRAPVTISFEASMNPASVESAFQLLPAQPVQLSWNDAHTALTVTPERQWRTDERYLVVIGSDSSTSLGTSIRSARRFAFTTVTAPAVADFQVHLAGKDLAAVKAAAAAKKVSVRSTVMAADIGERPARDRSGEPIGAGATSQPPTRTATKVSAATSISIDFSVPMDRADVERVFAIAPKIDGTLSWKRGSLVFTPSERLKPNTRYTISVLGAHDLHGNVLGGEGNFSFVVQASAHLTKTVPSRSATGVEPSRVSMWFTQPMDRRAVNKAVRIVDTALGSPVAGKLTWNRASTQLTFKPDQPLAAGRTFRVKITRGGRDADGNAVRAEWSFTTAGFLAPVGSLPARTTVTTRSAPAIPPAAPATSLAGYALNQVNAARAAYGFRPLVLDASISAVASRHAMDQAVNGYFSHYGLNGSTRESRLRAGGVSFGWSGENQCYLVGRGQTATLNWCHQQFMAEPYPGHWNHIGNILSPSARRMGVGIAQVGGKIVVTWNFTD
jgi:uncharacterized protein YkwD